MGELINLAGIEYDSVVDGPGLRTTIFVQGCNHHCLGCHNPETQGAGGYFTDTKLLAKTLTLGRDRVRVTFSGGEPMLQARQLIDLVDKMEGHGVDLDIWLYTGFTWEQIQQDDTMRTLAYMCDVVVDGPFILEERDPSLLFRGSSNQRLVDVKKTRQMGEVVEWK